MFTTDTVVTAAAADALKVTVASLPGWVSNIVVRAHVRAYNLIVRTLAAKGFSLAQITAWDEGVSFETDLGVYFSLVNNNVLHTIGVDERFAFSFDRSKELCAVDVLTTAGVAIYPTGPFGLPATGAENVVGPWDDESAAPFGQPEPW